MMLALLFTLSVNAFELGDCIKIKRKDPAAGVVFKISKKEKGGIKVRANVTKLDQSYLGEREIKNRQLKHFEKVSCDGGF